MPVKQPNPVLVRQEQGGWNLKYDTVHENSGEIIATTNVSGSAEEIILKTVLAHRNATLFAERLRTKLADLQVEHSRSK